jgi:hypothetical protein
MQPERPKQRAIMNDTVPHVAVTGIAPDRILFPFTRTARRR